jgi:hypothetical protein
LQCIAGTIDVSLLAQSSNSSPLATRGAFAGLAQGCHSNRVIIRRIGGPSDADAAHDALADADDHPAGNHCNWLAIGGCEWHRHRRESRQVLGRTAEHDSRARFDLCHVDSAIRHTVHAPEYARLAPVIPWCLAFPAIPGLSLQLVETGAATLRVDGTSELLLLERGDLILLTRGQAHLIGSDVSRVGEPFDLAALLRLQSPLAAPSSVAGCTVVAGKFEIVGDGRIRY